MLALRLTRAARLAVHLRRLLVAVASAGTGFLLLCALGHALSHPGTPGASALRLAWCAAPLAASVQLAVAVARTDPGTRPRSGLSAIGLGPARLLAVSATTTALSGALGSVAALLVFLHLRGDLAGGTSLAGVATDALAAGQSLPAPAVLTLLALVPATASAAVAYTLRPRDPRRAASTAARGYGRFGAYGWGKARETFGAYGRFGARWTGERAARTAAPDQACTGSPPAAEGTVLTRTDTPGPATSVSGGPLPAAAAGLPTAVAGSGAASSGLPTDGSGLPMGAPGFAAGGSGPAPAGGPGGQSWDGPAAGAGAPAPRPQNTTVLPWGVTALAVGLAVEAYTGDAGATPSAGVLIGWALTAVGLALAGPGLTQLCGRLLQAARPGALRLLAGRVLMEESQRVGRPLGVVAAVAAAGYVATTVYDSDGPAFGPLSTLGALLVAGCTLATLLTAAVEAKHARAGATDALLRLGAPPATLRAAAAVRAAALLALFGPLTLVVAVLAALPLSR
ncbi:hypothetical protein TPA0906_20380 [Streptomyces olivaceus]|uniref:hypothetical protein n=1 Tax=Streptomyces olivaceus TaxID=47716 RepID=UPI0022EDBE4A|nr:hypothetical protein [Streptomyces olivaceus]GHJ00173.1 hypothetical protein TPA0906_20380 [Streptomyces olivaceus]